MRKAVFLAVLLMGGVALVYAPPKNRPSGKSYYLSTTLHDGSEAPFACAAGYHMANIYEILDPTNIPYNQDLGVIQDDSGDGPPAVLKGWMRTGRNAVGSGTPWEANCLAYQSDDQGLLGTTSILAEENIGGSRNGAWSGSTAACDETLPVWCVSD
jgi:hypothetical protein